jgi:hypothetical protein
VQINGVPRTLEEDAIEIRLRAERRLGEMMAEQPKAQGGEQYHSEPTGISGNPVPTLASQGIDKNLANRAMTSKRVDADWVGHAG